jgi:hypothetical protein
VALLARFKKEKVAVRAHAGDEAVYKLVCLPFVELG